ncbi:hypothetical protein C8F01DRAFT_1249282 [Mycena amicta]|nr:hypothetical protein C8F01DRAFT_1249282 [Mycena amicta]
MLALSSLQFLAFLAYDYLLTLESEVTAFWRAKISFATILFFVNRYGVLLGYIPVLIICAHLNTYHRYLIGAVQVVIIAMMILRTYGLYGQSRRVLAVLAVSFSIALSFFIFGVIRSNALPADEAGTPIILDTGCTHTVPAASGLWGVLAWIGMTGFDCTIVVLTLYRTISHRHLVRTAYMRHPNSHHSSYYKDGGLVDLLLRDGSLYFAIFTLSNLANILTFVLGGSLTRGILNTFTNVLASVMISRLMLNLRLALHP